MASRQPTEPLVIGPGQAGALIALAVGLSAIWLFPLVTGGISIFVALLSRMRGERRAMWVIPVAVGCTALGLFLQTLPRSFFT